MASNLKVDIVRPTATNGSLSLKGDSGGSATTNGVTVNSSGNTNITGTTTVSSLVATTADINGGTIDGTDITVGSGKTLDVSAGTLTLANDQISGDNVEGGTIAATTITTLTSTTINAGDGAEATPSITNTGDTDTGIYFPAADTVGVSTNGDERMRIDSSGNVGIGTTSPYYKLHLEGSTPYIRSKNTSAPTDEKNWDFNAGSDGILRFRNTNDANNLSNNWLEVERNGVQTDSIRFLTASGSERMRIDSSGNLLVGTTSRAFSSTGIGLSPTGYSYITQSGTAPLELNRLSSTGNILAFSYNSSGVGSVSVSASATAYNTSSDYRLKEDYQPIADAIKRLKALNPVNFAWKVDGSRVDGFIAHETQEVVPEAVTGEKDAVDAEGNPEYQGVDYGRITPLLTAALQEAVSKIEMLEKRIAQLEAK